MGREDADGGGGDPEKKEKLRDSLDKNECKKLGGDSAPRRLFR